MGIYKRNEVWWMSYTDEDGKRHQLSLRVQEKRTAEKLYRKKVTEIAQGLNFATNAKNVPLSNLATEFLRRKKSNKCFKQDVSMVNQVVDHFGKGTSIKAIKPSDINAYVDSLDENYAHASKNKRLLILKGMFAIADENYNLKNPTKHIKISKPDNARERLCTEEEFELILSKIKDQELKTILTLCYESAFRISEVTSLERKQIDFKSNIIFLPSKKTKGNKSRPVPISKNTADMLKNLPPRIDGKVFSHKQSHYRYAFEIICQRARIDNLTFHDLRRTAATRMIMKGVDTFRVAQILGHSGLEMTRRYSIFKTEDLTAAFEMSLSV